MIFGQALGKVLQVGRFSDLKMCETNRSSATSTTSEVYESEKVLSLVMECMEGADCLPLSSRGSQFGAEMVVQLDRENSISEKLLKMMRIHTECLDAWLSWWSQPFLSRSAHTIADIPIG